MGDFNKDDAGSDFGDDLQYDFITPNFQSKNKSTSFVSLNDVSQHIDKQVNINFDYWIQTCITLKPKSHQIVLCWVDSFQFTAFLEFSGKTKWRVWFVYIGPRVGRQ